jgi:anthranilate phosphoribosyltransferase
VRNHPTLAAILQGKASEAEMQAFLQNHPAESVSASALADAQRTVMAEATPFPAFPDALDCCGTGGDGAHSLNVSTAVAIVVAACGIKVAKHGNRAVSSHSGSADVLAALGVNLDASPTTLAHCLRELGMAFLFAPTFHPGFRHIAPLRKAHGKRTLFNLLGPLCNPAHVGYHLLGVYGNALRGPMASALAQLGTKCAWVVHSADGLDEISISAPTHITALQHGALSDFSLTPEEAGVARHAPDALRGGTAAHNAARLNTLLAGEHSAYRDSVCINAAACLLIHGNVATMAEGMARAAQAIDSGGAAQLLARYVKASHEGTTHE